MILRLKQFSEVQRTKPISRHRNDYFVTSRRGSCRIACPSRLFSYLLGAGASGSIAERQFILLRSMARPDGGHDVTDPNRAERMSRKSLYPSTVSHAACARSISAKHGANSRPKGTSATGLKLTARPKGWAP